MSVHPRKSGIDIYTMDVVCMDNHQTLNQTLTVTMLVIASSFHLFRVEVLTVDQYSQCVHLLFNYVFQSRLASAIQVIVGGHVFAAGLATYFGNETWYEKFLMPALFRLTSSETGHRLAVMAAHYGLMPRVKTVCHPELVCTILTNFFS